jgi:formate dehydrogenase subunit beta
MEEITQRIREEARKLLQDGKVDVVIGYQQGWDEEEATPCFVTDESQVEQLIFNEYCYHNLAKYLVGREGYLTSHFRAPDERLRVAVVARPAALRTIVGLIQEFQFERDELAVLGILDGTPAGIEPDVVVGHIDENREQREQVLAEVEKLEHMSPSERWAWWEQQFAKCIRCYACRQVCPLCYCERCITDENQPQWIERSPSLKNNRTWNIIRAFHLVGRCVECGECDRVCPVDIPLSLIAAKMAKEVEAAFGHVAGTSREEKPALRTFRPDDPEEFIR